MKALMLALAADTTLIPAGIDGASALSDAELKKVIIAESITSYLGTFPCPHKSERAGRPYYIQSAYSPAGGYETVCYPSVVTAAMTKAYLAR